MYDKRRVKHSFLLLANHHKACTVSMFEPNRNESLEDNTLNSTAAGTETETCRSIKVLQPDLKLVGAQKSKDTKAEIAGLECLFAES